MGHKTGEWKVTSQMLGGTRKYAVVRIINVDEVEHNGNREYTEHGYMEDKAEAEAIAAQLNSENGQVLPSQNCEDGYHQEPPENYEEEHNQGRGYQEKSNLPF